MTEVQPAPSGASFAGTPVRDLIAGAVSFGVVMLGANLLAHSLKGVMDESVRTGAVGVLFASVPGVYGVTRKLAASVGPKPAKPAPELAPWYITGAMAGVILFAWTRFVSLLAGLGIGAVSFVTGSLDPSQAQQFAQAVSIMVALFVVPTLFVMSILAGYSLHKNTRSLSILSILMALVVLAGLDALLTFVLFPEFNMNLANAASGGEMAVQQWLLGFAIFAGASAIGLLIGMWSAMLRRERSVSGIASLAKRLSADDRETVDSDLRAKIVAKA